MARHISELYNLQMGFNLMVFSLVGLESQIFRIGRFRDFMFIVIVLVNIEMKLDKNTMKMLLLNFWYL